MADQHSRLPIQRGLVAERKARFQQIKKQSESPRRNGYFANTDSGVETIQPYFSTTFGTPTTVRSSPRRSRTSVISAYISNESLAEVLRRKQSSITISGPYPTKSQTQSTIFRKPTPFEPAKSEVSSSDNEAQVKQKLETDFMIHQPKPQSKRSSLADSLESQIKHLPPCLSLTTSFDSSSNPPSDSDFARVLSNVVDKYPPEKAYTPKYHVLKTNESQVTVRPGSITRSESTTSPSDAVTLASVKTSGIGKRATLRAILKGRARTEEDSTIQRGQYGSKIGLRRVFSKHSRVPSDSNAEIESAEPGALVVKESNAFVVVSMCKASHRTLEVLDDRGETAIVLIMTRDGWQLISSRKQQSRKCGVCSERLS